MICNQLQSAVGRAQSFLLRPELCEVCRHALLSSQAATRLSSRTPQHRSLVCSCKAEGVAFDGLMRGTMLPLAWAKHAVVGLLARIWSELCDKLQLKTAGLRALTPIGTAQPLKGWHELAVTGMMQAWFCHCFRACLRTQAARKKLLICPGRRSVTIP